MKNVILFLAVAGLMSFASCKKWDCYCSDGSHTTVSATNSTQAASNCVLKGNASVSCYID